VRSPPSSRMRFSCLPSLKAPSCCSKHQLYSSSVSPFQAKLIYISMHLTPIAVQNNLHRNTDSSDCCSSVVLGGEDVAGSPCALSTKGSEGLNQNRSLNSYLLVSKQQSRFENPTYSCEDIQQYLEIGISQSYLIAKQRVTELLTSTSQRLLLCVLGPSLHQTLFSTPRQFCMYDCCVIRMIGATDRHFLFRMSVMATIERKL